MEVMVVSECANDQAGISLLQMYFDIRSAFLFCWDLQIFSVIAFCFVVK